MNKKTLAIVHRWFGLTLGLLLVLQALAGTVLHFRDDLVRLSVGADRPVCTIAHLLARVPPDRHVQRIAFDGGGCAALVRLQAPDHLEFHVPVRGAAAGGIDLIESPVAGGLHWVFAFHHNMLMGTAGRWLNGLLAAGLLATTVIGIVLWWPGRARLGKALRVKWRAPPVRRWFDVHKITGLGFSLLVVATAATGVGLSFAYEMRTALVPPMPTVAVAGRSAGDALAVDDLVRRAQAQAPGLKRRGIRFLGATNLPYRFLFHADAPAGAAPPVQILIDPFSGQLVWRSDTAARPAVATALDWLYPIHTRFALGPVGRWLSVATGLALVILTGAGVLLWLSRRRVRAKGARVQKRRHGVSE